MLTETSDGHTLTKPVHEGPARPQLGRRYAQCAQWEQLLRRGLKTVCIASSNQSLQKEGEKCVNTLPLKVLLSTTSHFSLNCLRSSQEALILGNLSVIPSYQPQISLNLCKWASFEGLAYHTVISSPNALLTQRKPDFSSCNEYLTIFLFRFPSSVERCSCLYPYHYVRTGHVPIAALVGPPTLQVMRPAWSHC